MIRALLIAATLMFAGVAFAEEVEIPVSVQDLTELKVTAPKVTEIAESKEGAAPQALTPVSEEEIPVNLDAKVGGKSVESPLKDLVLACALMGGFGLLIYLGPRPCWCSDSCEDGYCPWPPPSSASSWHATSTPARDACGHVEWPLCPGNARDRLATAWQPPGNP